MTVEELLTVDKEQLPEAARDMDGGEIPRLVALLSEKNDSVRYRSFLALQYRSRFFSDVYPFWESFRSKLNSENSYQRSIGLMLLAENARWDSENRMHETIDELLALLQDEKPVTVRQCVQSLGEIAKSKPDLNGKIVSGLISLDLSGIRETMRKPVLLDILHVLADIRKDHPTDEMEFFFLQALSGDILDRKSKKQIEAIYRAAL